MSSKEVFRTWENWCLLKLKTLGRSTKKQWADSMDYNFSDGIDTIIENQKDRLKLTQIGTSNRGKKRYLYEVKAGVII